MFATLGRWINRWRWQVVVVWFVVLLAGGALGSRVTGRLTADMPDNSRLESTRVASRLQDLTDAGKQVVALIDVPVDDTALRTEIGAVTAELRERPGVVSVADPSSPGSDALVAKDGRALLMVVTLEHDLTEGEERRLVDDISGRLRAISPGEVQVGGSALLNDEFRAAAERDMQTGERVAVPIAFAVMIMVFGGLLLAAIPLVIAIAAVAASLLLLLAVSGLTDVSTFTINIITSLGVGFGIDYGLILVSRFREERANGLAVPDAVERTVATAGMTIAISGLTVAGSLIGLFAFGEPVLRSFAVAGIGVVLFAMAAAVTLLPAIVGLFGARIKPSHARPGHDGYFHRQSRFVQRHAVATVVVVGLLLVAVALPFGHARFQVSDARSLPQSSESRAVAAATAERFPARGADPVVVLADAEPESGRVAALQSSLRDLPGVAAVSLRPTPPSSRVTAIDVVPVGDSQGPTAQSLVRTIRSLDDVGLPIQVGGTAAHLVDFKRSVVSRLPVAGLLMALATFALLFLMTGSVAVPIKAIGMSVLSLGASFGALVWVFQEGHLSGLLGFDSVGSLDLFAPLLVFIFAFGLSMDYEVFLLSRIK